MDYFGDPHGDGMQLEGRDWPATRLDAVGRSKPLRPAIVTALILSLGRSWMSWEVLLPYATWLGNTPFAQWLGASTWRIAWLLTFHLFGLTVLLGSVLITSLHLLGLLQRRKPVAQLRRDVRPVLLVGLALMLVSGALIFTGGAQAYYEGYWFRLKMVMLTITLIFHFTVYRFVSSTADGRLPRFVYPVTGALLLILWFGVAWSGRAIAFF